MQCLGRGMGHPAGRLFLRGEIIRLGGGPFSPSLDPFKLTAQGAPPPPPRQLDGRHNRRQLDGPVRAHAAHHAGGRGGAHQVLRDDAAPVHSCAHILGTRIVARHVYLRAFILQGHFAWACCYTLVCFGYISPTWGPGVYLYRPVPTCTCTWRCMAISIAHCMHIYICMRASIVRAYKFTKLRIFIIALEFNEFYIYIAIYNRARTRTHATAWQAFLLLRLHLAAPAPRTDTGAISRDNFVVVAILILALS